MIKKIYTFGTSFTQGGGFEFDVIHSDYKKIYEGLGEELTQYNFSWPGQLQKLLPNIEVINLAKSGYGNERIYRLVVDLVLSEKFNHNECLFLFEFSYVGRKEYYSNKLKDYIIVNYGQNTLHGFARTYKQKKEISDKELSKLPDRTYFENLVSKTLNDDIQLELSQFSVLKLLSFLNNKSINYLLTQPMIFSHNTFNLEKYNLHDLSIKSFQSKSLVSELENLTITDETNGVYEDSHFGLIGAKFISSKVYDELVSRGFINKKLLNKKISDFNSIKNKIKTNIEILI